MSNPKKDPSTITIANAVGFMSTNPKQESHLPLVASFWFRRCEPLHPDGSHRAHPLRAAGPEPSYGGPAGGLDFNKNIGLEETWAKCGFPCQTLGGMGKETTLLTGIVSRFSPEKPGLSPNFPEGTRTPGHHSRLGWTPFW